MHPARLFKKADFSKLELKRQLVEKVANVAGIGLKTRITVALSILLVSVISATTFFYLRYFEEHFKKTILEQQFRLISVIADDFDSKISSSQNLLVEVAQEIDPDLTHDKVKAKHFLNHQTELLKTFDNGIFLYDRFGSMIAEAPIDTGRVGSDLSFREYFPNALSSRKPYISKPYFSSQKDKHPVVMFTAPVFDRDQKLVGIMAGGLDLIKGGFLSKIRSIRIGENGFIHVANMERTIHNASRSRKGPAAGCAIRRQDFRQGNRKRIRRDGREPDVRGLARSYLL